MPRPSKHTGSAYLRQRLRFQPHRHTPEGVGATAILCAIETELKPFREALTQRVVSSSAMLTVHEGILENMRVVAVCCGVCKVNAAVAAQMLIDRYGVSRLIMSGTAGGIDRRLHIGDTVVGTETLYHDVKDVILTEQHPYLPDLCFQSDKGLITASRRALHNHPPAHSVYYGRIVTGETFIMEDGRKDIVEKFDPLCVDMETAAAAHVCHVNAVPFLAVRSISDTEDDVGYGSFFQNAAMASDHSYLVVKALLHELSQKW